ncbi:hypothetical protein TDB9533_02108 [Thalassocella blandensis]|nr:hypothetical protein TDB9533_02108 [Thalassocella blandensis]
MRISLLFFLLGLCSSVFASGVSPFLPMNVSPILEKEVERLAVVAGIPNLNKPYSLATIYLYMDKIRNTHHALYGRLSVALEPYTAHAAITHASVTVADSDSDIDIPNSRGENTSYSAMAQLRAHWQVADWYGIYLGAQVSDNFEQASGSHIALGTDWAQLNIGYRDFWWSPMQGSAQVLSTQAQSFPSISLGNTLPIEIFGMRWSYEGFVARTSRQFVQYNGTWSDKERPYLLGAHLSVQPTEWFTLGASRVMQFGGGERPVSLKTLFNAFFDPGEADNAQGENGVDEESGNQIASLQSKINFDGPLPFSVSIEFAGEDTSKSQNHLLGNSAFNAGLFFPYFFSDSLSLTYEYSDWQDAWYSNHIYQYGGYVNEGVVMGHWAMQVQRENSTAIEGNSHYLDLTWQLPWDHVMEVLVRTSHHYDASAEIVGIESDIYQDATYYELRYTLPTKSHSVTAGAFWGQDNFGNDFAQFSIKGTW